MKSYIRCKMINLKSMDTREEYLCTDIINQFFKNTIDRAQTIEDMTSPQRYLSTIEIVSTPNNINIVAFKKESVFLPIMPWKVVGDIEDPVQTFKQYIQDIIYHDLMEVYPDTPPVG